MIRNKFLGPVIAGACAGAINGLFGAGGGMLLVPLLGLLTDLDEQEIFPSSVAVILPLCIVSLIFAGNIPWLRALPYMVGSAAGGLAAGLWGRKIPTRWLHRCLGILILWGGLRYLWNS